METSNVNPIYSQTFDCPSQNLYGGRIIRPARLENCYEVKFSNEESIMFMYLNELIPRTNLVYFDICHDTNNSDLLSSWQFSLIEEGTENQVFQWLGLVGKKSKMKDATIEIIVAPVKNSGAYIQKNYKSHYFKI